MDRSTILRGLEICAERPDTADARALIAELDAELTPGYPSASRYGYRVDKLLAQGVAFRVLRVSGAAAGCGGIQLFGTAYGELKRMYVRPRFRGAGLAHRLIEHLADYARAHGVPCLRLETGIHQHAAIALYERAGFRPIAAFGDYAPGPHNLFFEKQIA